MDTNMPKVEYGLKRLLKISFDQPNYDNEMAAMLAGEFIRRVAVLADEQKINLASPFFDPLSVISIEGNAAQRAMQEFQSKLGIGVKNAYIRRTCECYLQWCEGIDAADVIANAHADIFEPLIRLLELGGSFGFHHGELLVGTSAIPLRDWKRFLNAVPLLLNRTR